MKGFGSILVFLFAVACAVLVRAEEAKEFVVTLGSDNFNKFMEEHPVSLVEFYAPWCGHCKKLAPEFEKAAEKLQATGGIPLAKVDATAEKELAQKFEIQGFPTIFLFRNGKHETYSGGRTAEKILEWIDLATGPAIIEVASLKEAEDLKVDKLKVVGQFKSNTSPEFNVFKTAADSRRQMGKFVAVVNSQVEQDNHVRLQHAGEDAVEHTITTDKKIAEFLDSEEFPLFGSINGETYGKYAERSEKWFWVASDSEAYEKVAPVARRISKNYRGEYNFVWLDIKEFEGHAKSGLGMETFPAIAVQTPEGRYLYKEDITSEKKITKFLEAVRSGKAEKHFKSEPIPEANDEAVKVVVGKSFEKIVLDNEKDVLLEIYAPWCGHCKQLQPIYDEFAANMKDSKNLVVAKMDGTANEPSVSGFDYNGFPTLYFVPAGASKPMPYDGARTVEGFTDFVKKNAKHPITVGETEKDEL